MLKLIVIVTAVLVGCSPASRKYHRAYQRVLLAGIGVAGACDLGQTLNVSNGGRWDGIMQENNPLLGKSPGKVRLIASAVVAVGLLIGLSEIPHWALPEEVQSTLLTYVAVAQVHNVVMNARMVDRGVTWCGAGPPLARLGDPP
jgi:hypothetical protein